MRLHKMTSGPGKGYTTWGCIWERGKYGTDSVYTCRNRAGEDVPMQTRITAYWPDGTVKWTAHTAKAETLGEEMEVFAHMSENGNKSAAKESEKEMQTQGMTSMLSGCIKLTDVSCGIEVDAGVLRILINKSSDTLFEKVFLGDREAAINARPILLLEEPVTVQGNPARMEKRYLGHMDAVEIEEQGELQIIVKYTGSHVSNDGERKLPFIIRMKVGYDCPELHFTHTFLYDGDEEKDYLKGLGITFDMEMKGALYNRHIKIQGDHGMFHEVVVPLTAWRPPVSPALYERQMSGECMTLAGEELKKAEQILRDVPFWSTYDICQNSASHFQIRKKLSHENCSYIDCLHGGRSRGCMAVGSEAGSVFLGIRDFWEKYPSGYTVEGLDGDKAKCTLWLWSPTAPVMDFRHYADRGYSQVCYEGYDYKGAAPQGIACTNECAMGFSGELIPADEEIADFSQRLSSPVQYVGTPEYYHELRAFGYWSLPVFQTEMERWLEKQLEDIFEFYKQEVEQRGWYGMFNYGDFMHTYDPVRHKWKYDIGGYAWDNTELVPTLWLWLYFLRTGREDVYRLAEKLSRHASEVDVYHMGPYKGLGSRHNVSHWGCPCKEARIAMAGHHRVYYYLTGDRRMEDIFSELKDNEMSFLNKDPLGDFFRKEEMVYPSHARSGPDWSSLCSNWMTQWERFGDTAYRNKIETGIEDIRQAPLRLISGPDYEFDPATCHLRYIGERETGGTHLQICMGSPQIWFELAELLGDEDFKRMLAELGRFYFLTDEERKKESGGILGKRQFTYPFMAAGMGAYAAKYLGDAELAKRTWRQLLFTILKERDVSGFSCIELVGQGNQERLREIPWISTNFVAQFCLNTIMALEWIKDSLPATLKEAEALTAVEGAEDYFHKA